MGLTLELFWHPTVEVESKRCSIQCEGGSVEATARSAGRLGGVVEAGVNTRRGADKLGLGGMITVSYGGR